MRRLYIDKQEVTQDHYDKIDGAISMQRGSESGGAPNTWNASITLCGDIAEYLKNKLLPPVNPADIPAEMDVASVLFPSNDGPAIAEVILTEDCCGTPTAEAADFPFIEGKILFQGKITRDNIEFCEDGPGQNCCITVTVTDNTPEGRAYKCLRDKLITDSDYRRDAFDHGFQGRDEYPYIPHCYEIRPSWLQYIIYVLGAIMLVLLLLWAVILGVFFFLLLIVDLILTLIGTVDIDPNRPGNQTSIILWLKDTVTDFARKIFGCENAHPSPYVRQYIQNGCDHCGLQFQSSILNDAVSDYYNTMLLNAPVHDGIPIPVGYYPELRMAFQQNVYFEKNQYIINNLRFLEQLATHFNAEYWIIDGVLHFEPKGLRADLWFDATQGDFIENATICWRSADEPLPVTLELRYGGDAVDIVGNEADEVYSQIIPLDNPPDPNRSGIKTYIAPFSPSRFRSDENWSSVANPDQGYPNPGHQPIQGDDVRDSFTGFYDFFGGGVGSASNFWLLLSMGKTSQPKLIIRKPGETTKLATAMRFDKGGDKFIYNAPLLFANWAQINGAGDGLYPRFYRQFYDAAFAGTYLNMKCTVTVPFNCELLNTLNLEKIVTVTYRGVPKNIKIEEIQIEGDNLTITGTA